MKQDTLHITHNNGEKVKYVFTDTLLPDDLVELYARSVGYQVRTGIAGLQRPTFSVRQEMLKVP